MKRPPTVLLFDVDGTLVTTGGAGRRAFERTFEVVYGRPEACSHFSFDGMTDRAIARNGLAAIGIEATDAKIDELLAKYLTVLGAEVERAEAARYRLHEGMADAVDQALGLGMAVGLGTGNIKEGARIKLARVGIADRFAFGGFGDDHELRPALIRIGAERGAARLGVRLEEARVVIIGDTPKDVAAAQSFGAQSLAVATGSYKAAQLEASGATWVFEHLGVAGAIDALLGR